MHPQKLLDLARQGNSSAIAILLNQVTKKNGASAYVHRDGRSLQILLIDQTVPDPLKYTKIIEQGMRSLKIPNLDLVEIAGRTKTDAQPIWVRRITIKISSKPAQNQLKPLPPPLKSVKPNLKSAPKKNHIITSYYILLTLIAGFSFLFGTGSYILFSQASPNTQIPHTPNTSPPPPIAQSPNKPASITIKSVGDIVLGTNFPDNRLPSNPNIFFEQIKSKLTGVDILFGNYESTLTNHRTSAKDTSRSLVFAFRSPPSYANVLKQAGFDVINTANNHSFDFGVVGFNDTMNNLEKAGIKAFGRKEQILYQNYKGLQLAWIGFSYLKTHNSILDIAQSQALVKKAASQADIVVVSFHGGAEGSQKTRTKNETEYFAQENRGNSVLFARRMIDSGADLVIGHGPHVLRGLELYKGKLIAYSLGNFVGYRTLSTQGTLGTSMILETTLNTQGNFIRGQIIPVMINRPGLPSYDPNNKAIKLIQNLTKSDFPQTPLIINNSGQISLPNQN